ncbi:uncharacterized protein LOC111261773 [Varroa jacobsoni]|uniref:uncharacterized protein LOC111261773 n=1 Tax=Varroa jacobsoni TaxID=62625 RepID=UPI000BF3C1EE|nr:uncharacterized protein LOC111261773 [Varroa jacobsoni]
MTQIAFLIDVSWLQDEEITAAVRYSCLQLLTAWPSSRCKFGYLLFDSEGPRSQKVQPVDFAAPSTNLFEEFEAQLGQGASASEDGKPSSCNAGSTSRLETIRWAVSRSITDFAWHSVSVCSPVKASRHLRKRRCSTVSAVLSSQQALASTSEYEHGNRLFLFARMPCGTLARIRDELVTPSLNKCLQESRIELTWVHDSQGALHTSSGANNAKCLFLRMRDLVQLCGFFPSECAYYSTMMAPPSLVVTRLLQSCSGTPKFDRITANCSISFNRTGRLNEPLNVTVLPTSVRSQMQFEAADMELMMEQVVDEPTVTSVLQRSQALFFVVSSDVHFHRVLIELKLSRKVALLTCGRSTFMLKSVADSIGALVTLTDRNLTKFEFSEVPSEFLFHGALLEKCYHKVQPSDGKKTRTKTLVNRLAYIYEFASDVQTATEHEFGELEVEPLPDTVQQDQTTTGICGPPENYNSEATLLQGLRHTYEKAIDNKLNATTSAQSIVSASMHFFESDFVKTIAFIEENFKPPLQSCLNKVQWANECRTYILISFELACLTSANTDKIRKHVIATMRKLLFLTSPRDLFDFIRETLKALYLEAVRPLLEDLAEEFDLPLFPESDEEEDISSMGSFAEPMSGISSLGGSSVINSMPRSAPMGTNSHKATVLRKLSSANISQQQLNQQRQIEIPRRRSVRITKPETSTNPLATSLSPQKRQSSSRNIPTTPKGKRILKTQVVPETPVTKQAPNRVHRHQERLRRRSSILNGSQGGASAGDEDDVDEIAESPVKQSATMATQNKSLSVSPTKRSKANMSPSKENVVIDREHLVGPAIAPSPATEPSPTRKGPRVTPRKRLTRQLKFSPPKKQAFTSPTAISLLHLTTSPVLFRPSKKRSAPLE